MKPDRLCVGSTAFLRLIGSGTTCFLFGDASEPAVYNACCLVPLALVFSRESVPDLDEHEVLGRRQEGARENV